MEVEEVAAATGRSRKVAGTNGGEHHAPSPSKADEPAKEKRKTRRGGEADSSKADSKKKLDLGKEDAQPKPAPKPAPPKKTAEPSTVALSKKTATPTDPNFLTPLAQAQLASVGGTPASTPDRPLSDVSDRLDAMTTKLEFMDKSLEYQRNQKSMLEKELADVKKFLGEQEEFAAAQTAKILELSVNLRGAQVKEQEAKNILNEKERIIAHLNTQSQRMWQAFCAATNIPVVDAPITAFPSAPV